MKRFLLWLGVFIVTIGIALPFLPNEIPLFNTAAVRPDRLASKYMLLLIPLCVSGLYLVDTLLLTKLSLHNQMMRRLTKAFILFLTVVAYFSLLRIIVILL